MVYNFNDTQTQLTEELLSKLDRDTKAELYEVLDQIQLVANMTNPKRARAKDLDRDSLGRIIVDLTNPHILEDMDYFRPAALHFQEHGTYTNLYPNPHPNSEYSKFWAEEARRCREGYVRESDGEWIPGYYYYYLNYSPILLVKKVQVAEEFQGDKARAERVHDFPAVWDSDYLYFHYIERGESKGLYGNCLKTRGRGYSFKAASMDGRNIHLFKGSKSYSMASEKEYLTKDGIITKAWDNLDWVADTTPFPSARLIDREMHKKIGYVDTEKNVQKGLKSEIIGVSLKDNPDKARGKRGKLIKWEESGVFPGLRKAWGVARMSLEDGRNVFGYMVAFGTGGTEGADFEAAEEFFYNPEGYNILSLPNVYDKNAAKGKCSFFVPEYLNRANCYDENGNSDVIKALVEVLEDRLIVKRGTSDPNALVQEKADRPITPQEAVMRKEGSIFPIGDLKDHLASIMPNLEKYVSAHWVGRLAINSDSGEVDWKIDDSVAAIRDFPLKDNQNRAGALEIFEMPYKDSTGNVPHGLYIAGIDPIDDDDSGTSSLYSMFIMNTLTERIVAEYTGRTFDATDVYELTRRALIFYNAQANYENDKKGLYAYFKNKNCLHLLADTPEIIKDMNIGTISRIGNKSKGCNSSKQLNAWARRLQAQWMVKQAYTNEDLEETQENLMNLHRIRSIGYIKEAIQWNIDGNFDRVSAMGMLMILKEDRARIDIRIDEDNSDEFTSGDFWNRKFKSKSDFSYNGLENFKRFPI
jgi:hypothetical protein